MIIVRSVKWLNFCSVKSTTFVSKTAIVTFKDITLPEIDETLKRASDAFFSFKNLSLAARRDILHSIAAGLEAHADDLVATAASETHLGNDRLKGELGRTCFQLRSYADAAAAGHHLEPRIDHAMPDRKPAPRADIRKVMVPLGPVVVFGSSNFPFAYSTAGGDTACALAAGCPVIVKAHPAHAGTSEKVANIILATPGLPRGAFAHVHGMAFEVGKALVTHPLVKAVGFTGSTSGGRALFDWAASRPDPIPVFSEMGSINPVFLLPERLAVAALDVATQYAASITLGVGQFCTNPGLLVGIRGSGLDAFQSALSAQMAKVPAAPMLHPGIARAYADRRQTALSQSGVDTLASGEGTEGVPTLARTKATEFLSNPVLHAEVFGPYSLLVECSDAKEMLKVALHLEGQLTSTLIATENEFQSNGELVEIIQQRCGRFVWNGVPTGVEVVAAMQHGGPYPATTDSRFTSVGEDGIRRFMRPLCYQNVPDAMLPDALKESNPLGIWRLVDGEWLR